MKIEFRFAIENPLAHCKANSTALRDATTETAGNKESRDTRHWPDDWSAIGRKTNGTVHNCFDAGIFQCRYAVIDRRQTIFKPVKVICEKLLPE